MADKSFTIDKDQTLEIDYSVEEINDSAINVKDEPSNGSSSINYIDTKTAIFNPSESGSYTSKLVDLP